MQQSQDPDDPPWRRRARAMEFWAITAFVAGSFVYGVIAAVVAMLIKG